MTELQIIKSSLNRRDTDELMKIWVEHDRKTWTENAFVAVSEILRERGFELPDEFGEEAVQRLHEQQHRQAKASALPTSAGGSKPLVSPSPKNYGLAIAACFCIVIAYSMLSAAMGWRRGGGAIPMLLFLIVLRGTWRALTKPA